MNDNSELLQGEEVISVSSGDSILIGHKTFTVDEFTGKLSSNINHVSYGQSRKWLIDGVACKMLSPQQGWRKGKIKIRLEFIPDTPEIQEPESCLDDIRREIQKM